MSGLVTEAKKGLIRGFCLKIERLKKFMDVRNLPCFIYKMREILDAILEGGEYIFVCVVSLPHKSEDLNHEPDNSETLKRLLEQLDLLPSS